MNRIIAHNGPEPTGFSKGVRFTMFTAVNSVRRRVVQGLVAISFLTLAACDGIPVPGLGGGTASGGPQIDTSRPVPVALLVPNSSASAGVVGRSLEQAAKLAVADLGDVKIDLRVYDTGGDAARAATLAQQAVDDGAKVIVGPLFADGAVEASKAVVDEGINVLAFSNNTSIAGGNLFILGPTFANTANRLVGYAAAQGKRRGLIVHPQNVEGTFGKQAIEAAAARGAMTIVGSEGFEFSQTGVVSAVPKIASAARTLGADAVFLTSNSAGALPLLAQLLPEAGVRSPAQQYIGLARWDVPPQTVELPGLEGGWFTMPDQGAATRFRGRYQAAYGEAPHQLAGLGYDAVNAIGALVKAGKSNALTGAALTQTAGFQGTTGVFRLRPDGTNERGLAVAAIRDKKVVILDPAPRAFGGAGS